MRIEASPLVRPRRRPARAGRSTACASRGSAWRFSHTNGCAARAAAGAGRTARASAARERRAGGLRSRELPRPHEDRRDVERERERLAVAVEDLARDAGRARSPRDAGAPPAARSPARAARRGRRRGRAAARSTSAKSAAMTTTRARRRAARAHGRSTTCPFCGSAMPSRRARLGQRGRSCSVASSTRARAARARGEAASGARPTARSRCRRPAGGARPAACRAARDRAESVTRRAGGRASPASAVAGRSSADQRPRIASVRGAPRRCAAVRSSCLLPSSRSTTRSRALRARGLLATSSPPAAADAGSAGAPWRASRSAQRGRPGRAEAARGPAAERLLHAPVLERMIGEDREPPAGRSSAQPSARKRRARRARRSPRCGAPGRCASRDDARPGRGPHARHDLGELGGGRSGRARTMARATARARGSSPYSAMTRRRGRAPSQSFTTVGGGELGAGSMRMSSGPSCAEAEAARRVVELQRAHAEVEQDGVGAVPALAASCAPRSAKVPAGGGRGRRTRRAAGRARASAAGRGRCRAAGSPAPRRAAPRHEPPSPTVASTRQAPGRGRSPPTTCPTITGTWAAPTGPMSVSSARIGGPSPRIVAALRRRHPSPLSRSPPAIPHVPCRLANSRASRNSSSSKILSSCSPNARSRPADPRCGTCRHRP